MNTTMCSTCFCYLSFIYIICWFCRVDLTTWNHFVIAAVSRTLSNAEEYLDDEDSDWGNGRQMAPVFFPTVLSVSDTGWWSVLSVWWLGGHVLLVMCVCVCVCYLWVKYLSKKRRYVKCLYMCLSLQSFVTSIKLGTKELENNMKIEKECSSAVSSSPDF